MNGNYIKINRSMLEWGWYKDEHTKSLFLHCILKANWKQKEFKGVMIKRGQFVSSIPSFQVDLGLTSNEVRTAIKHLKSTGEITVRAYSKFSVFTVVNYDLYQVEPQAEPQAINSQSTDKPQAINSLLTTIEEGKKERKKEGNKKTSFEPSEFDLQCVEKLIKSCKETVNNAKVPESDNEIAKWAVEIDRMKRLDKRTEEEITAVLDYAVSNSFWKSNIRSTGKFREKFEVMYAQMKRDAVPKKVVVKNNNNFERRQYDMDSVEQQLLEAGRQEFLVIEENQGGYINGN